MNDSAQPLDGRQVIADYVQAFGNYDRDLMKAATAVQAGTDLLRELRQAVQAGKPMDFKCFAQRVHERLAESSARLA